MGNLTKYGLNTSAVGTKFDYTFIEMVSDEILYLVNEINPSSPNVNIVKNFKGSLWDLKMEIQVMVCLVRKLQRDGKN